MSLPDVIKAALDQIQLISKTETIIGEPIVAGKVTLIPVSKVSIGFAAGGAGNESKSNSGAGTGGGVNVIPVAFIGIVDDKVNVYPIDKSGTDLSGLIKMAPDLIAKIAKFLGKNKDKNTEEKDP